MIMGFMGRLKERGKFRSEGEGRLCRVGRVRERVFFLSLFIV